MNKVNIVESFTKCGITKIKTFSSSHDLVENRFAEMPFKIPFAVASTPPALFLTLLNLSNIDPQQASI